MQETLKRVTGDLTEPVGKTVTLFSGSTTFVLTGEWIWEMQSQAVYCSDVMSFPSSFFGTKGIIHPDDLPGVTRTLELLAGGGISALEFRLITTYGEVKTISGKEVSLELPVLKATEPGPEAETIVHAFQDSALKEEINVLQIHKEISEISERLHETGTWYLDKHTGACSYSDEVFRIHGLPPQSLNAHSNTFNHFIHPEDSQIVLDAVENAYSRETPLHLEYRVVQPDGNIRYVQQVIQWSYSRKGNRMIYGIIRDITEERTMTEHHEAVESKANLLQQILNLTGQNLKTGYWYVNLANRKSTYSDQYFRIFGIRESPLLNINSFLESIHPEDRDRIGGVIKKMFEEHVFPETEFRIIRPDGKVRYLKQTGKLVTHNRKEPVMVIVVVDLTDKHILKQQLLQVNQTLSLQNFTGELVEQMASTASLLWLEEGQMVWSDGFYRILGYRAGPQEPSEKLLYKSVHPHDLKKLKEALTLVRDRQHHEDLDFRIISRLGIRQLRISFRQVVYENKDVLLGVVRDITQVTNLERQLSQRTSYTEMLQETSNDVLIFTNTENTVISWNYQAEEKTGIRKANAVNRNLFDLFPALNEEHYLHRLHGALAGADKIIFKDKKGYLHAAYHCRLIPIKDENGEVSGVLHIVQDNSTETELQQELNDRLNFIESLVESSVDRIVVLDRHMNYLYWNRKAEEYYALNKERVIGKNILEVFPGFRNDPSYQEFRKVLKGETVYIPAVLSEDAQWYFETYLIPVKNEKEEVTSILWIVHDLRKEMSLKTEQLLAMRRLEEEHRRLKDAQAIGHIGSFEREFEDENLVWSDEMYRMHGLEPQSEPIDFARAYSFIHPDDLPAMKEAMDRLYQTGEPLNIFQRIIRADGAVRYVHRRAEILRDDDGNTLKIYGTLQDISESRIAEQELKKNKELLQAIFESVPFHLSYNRAVRNKKGRVVDFTMEIMNDTNLKAINLSRKEIGKSILLILPGIQTQPVWQSMVRVAETGEPGTEEISYNANGSQDTWYLLNTIRFMDGVLVAAVDISDRKKAEAQLQKHFAILKNSEELTEMGSWEFEIGSGNFNWSDGMYRLFGLQQGIPVSPEIYLDHTVEEDRSVARRLVRNLRKDQKPFEDTLHIRRGDQVRLIRVKASVLHNEKGEPEKVVGVDIDLTDIKEAEEKLKETQNLVEQTALASPDAITVYDLAKKQPLYLNNCLAEWIGKTSEELVQMGISGRISLIHPDDRLNLLHFNEKVAAADDRDILSIDYRIRTSDHHYIWIRNRAKVFARDASGKVTHILSVLQDITEEKKYEAALKELNASLEKKNRDLESKNEEITSFAFVASHDLKEPLRKIHMFSDLLLNKEESMSGTGKQSIEKLTQSLKKLDILIEDILALTKIEADRSEMTKVNLNAVLENVKEEMKGNFQATGASIYSIPLPVITGFENHLHYLFKNLISNAIKFQPKDHKPELKIHVEEEEDFLKISLTDNGIGIDPRHQKKIFQIFQRLHSHSEYEGTGMGLAICKKIMEKHGGKITVKSELGKGSTFTCWFPK